MGAHLSSMQPYALDILKEWVDKIINPFLFVKKDGDTLINL